MKRHVAILAAGALALTAGFFVSVQTSDDANAAMRSFSTSRSFTSNRTFSNKTFSNKTFSNKTFSNKTFSNKTFSNKTFSKTKFNNPTKFSNTKFNNNTKFSNTKFNNNPNKFGNANKFNNPTKFGNLPKNGVTQLGPKGLKGVGPKFAGPGFAPKLLGKGPTLTLINKQNFTIWRGPRGIWWNGRMRTLVALGVIGGLTIGSTYYLADGYVPVAYPACRGMTAEGCSLQWRDVPTDDGAMIAQCVQFCPSQPSGTAAVPAPTVVAAADTRAVAAPAAAAMAQGCVISIHADANFGGVNSEVTADQPQLSVAGWDKSISSVQVKSGTWDFYTDDNYGGEMIRLSPGQYPTLAQGWDKNINSLMCAQP